MTPKSIFLSVSWPPRKGCRFVIFFIVVLLLCFFDSLGSQLESLTAEEFTKTDEIAEKVIVASQGSKGSDRIKEMAPAAMSLLKQASAARPNNVDYHYALYLCYVCTDRNREALTEIKSAWLHSGQNEKYLMSYALALNLTWQPVQARDLLSAWSKQQGNPLEIETIVAQANLKIQEYQKAAPIFQQWLKESGVGNPVERTTIMLGLGECQLFLGSPQGAIYWFRQAVKVYPENVLAKRRWMTALVQSGNPEMALAFYDRELKGRDDNEHVLYYKGVALEAVGKKDEARTTYQKALQIGEQNLKIGDDNGDDHFILHLICCKLNLLQQAREYKKNAARLHFTFEAPFITNESTRLTFGGVPQITFVVVLFVFPLLAGVLAAVFKSHWTPLRFLAIVTPTTILIIGLGGVCLTKLDGNSGIRADWIAVMGRATLIGLLISAIALLIFLGTVWLRNWSSRQSQHDP